MSADSPHDPKYQVKKLVPIETSPIYDERDPELVLIKDQWFRLEDLPAGEPIFVLRGQDRDAEAMVYIYAGRRSAREGLSTAVQHILAHADDFARWTPKKVAD